MPAPDAATLARWREDIRFEDTLRGQSLKFSTTWGIFSPEAIDDGSRLLLDLLEVAPDADCLDIGCGYGPLGMTLARLAPQGQTLMVDKDFMAVEYANRNCALNGIGNARAMLSNGLQHIDPALKFDLILSNLPAKASKEQHYLFLFDSLARLKPGGRFYVVTINGLREFMARTLKEVFGNYDKLKQGKVYTVAMAEKR
ncbi:class I SAM-dependent methyltransferase [Amnimonas aquatica]|uniref:Methyltransferase n=1 Tax=Amnimonas aquatica TaxID=2094561 RepID=A0A2P6ARY6_9GAMM|nr:methyltransferase [Amnimonas aquatica]PQA39703.1 methyltransferase [Amnimonas aquatica]